MSQNFKKSVPNTLLFDLLKNICSETDKYYLLSKTSFKLAVYHNYCDDLCSSLKEYYHKSKVHYAERKLNYNRLVTIIRQICSHNNISYASNIIYNNSTYDIVYYIYKPVGEIVANT